MPKITHVPASTSRKIPICTCASEPMRLTKLKPNPVMVTTPMTMPTQAQHAAIVSRFAAAFSMAARKRAGVRRVSGLRKDKGNHGGAGEQGREEMLLPAIMRTMSRQRREVELALDGAQFGDEIGRLPPSPCRSASKWIMVNRIGVIEHGGQERGLADAQVADAGVFGHDEGDVAHDRGA